MNLSKTIFYLISVGIAYYSGTGKIKKKGSIALAVLAVLLIVGYGYYQKVLAEDSDLSDISEDED